MNKELTEEQKKQLNEIEKEFNLLIKNESNEQLIAQYTCFLLLLKNYAYKNSFFFTRINKEHRKGEKFDIKNKQLFISNYNEKSNESTYFATTFWDIKETKETGSVGTPASMYQLSIKYSFKKKNYLLTLENFGNEKLTKIFNRDFASLILKLKLKSENNKRLIYVSERYDDPIELIDKYKDIIDEITLNKDYIKTWHFDKFVKIVNKRLELIKSSNLLNKESKDDVEPVTNKNKQKLTISSKNTILYGPPGTGKTYKTKKLAVEAIEK